MWGFIERNWGKMIIGALVVVGTGGLGLAVEVSYVGVGILGLWAVDTERGERNRRQEDIQRAEDLRAAGRAQQREEEDALNVELARESAEADKRRLEEELVGLKDAIGAQAHQNSLAMLNMRRDIAEHKTAIEQLQVAGAQGRYDPRFHGGPPMGGRQRGASIPQDFDDDFVPQENEQRGPRRRQPDADLMQREWSRGAAVRH